MSEQQQKEVFEDLKKYVGPALHITRVKSRLTQKELAEKLGVGEGAIDDIEQKKRNISFDELQRFCNTMQVEIVLIFKMAKFLEEQDGRPEK